MSQPSLELKVISLVDFRLEALSACCVLHHFLLHENLLELDTIICLILPWTCVLHCLQKVLTLLFSVNIFVLPAVNPLMQVLSLLLSDARVSS